MPVAKIHGCLRDKRYDEVGLGQGTRAVQDGLMSALGARPDDFFQIFIFWILLFWFFCRRSQFPSHAVVPGPSNISDNLKLLSWSSVFLSGRPS